MSLLLDTLGQHARQQGDTLALRDATRSISYAELPDCIADKAAALRDKRCRTIGLQLDNGIDWVLWDLAAIRAGVVCVPLPGFFTPQQTEHVIHSAGIDHRVTPQGLQASEFTGQVELPVGTSKITFTSGTTGTPKGVCLSQSGLEQVVQSLVSVIGKQHAARHLAIMPLAVLLENVAGVYSTLLAGACCHLYGLADIGMSNPFQPDFRALLQCLQQQQISSAILVPELLRGLMHGLRRTGTTLPDLRFMAVGGSKVAPELLAQAHTLGLPVYEGYGLSECGSVVALNTPAASQPGSAGKPLPHIRLDCRDGEIIVHDPAFLGYLHATPPECGDFATGDLGHLDADGFLHIAGRRKNLLITSFGRNISPEWVESQLLTQPEIAQAVVFGDAQPTLTALLVPSCPQADLTAAVQRANQALPAYAHIHHVHTIAPFRLHEGTLTGTGRPRREAIAARYHHLLEEEKIMDFYSQLVLETAEARQELYTVPQLGYALQGKISVDTYRAYLTQAYHHVKHTVRFLMSMGANLPADKQWLQTAIAEYIEEEVGHEEWILNDIAATGGDKEATRHAIPHLETEVLVAYNYDYIRRRNPVGFLGMVFMLESTSIQLATQGAKTLQTSLGLPATAFTYLSSHGTLDIGHMQFFRELVNRIHDPQDQLAILEVAQNTFRLFARVLGSIPLTQEVKHAA